MAKLAKFLQGVAGAGGGAGLNVEEVFSTYLYDGTGATQTITNGIDLDGEGGLVWIKQRTDANNHMLFDTERGVSIALNSNQTDANNGPYTNYGVTSYNSSGFNLGGQFPSEINDNGHDYASWTFRKAPKFFDVVTWTGDGTSNRAIPHNLGCAVGSYFVKCTSDAFDWLVWHKDSGANNYNLVLNTTAAVANFNLFSTTAPDSSNVYLGTSSLDYYNASGRTYVAYLFAHNNSDGEFGPTGDQDIIKCGSYTGNGGYVDINLGWEPQWVLVKKATGTGNWTILDNMRGWVNSGGFVTSDQQLYPNLSDAETAYELGHPTATGWQEQANTTSGETYIYIAIRRGPMAVPESATDVFAIDQGDGSSVPAFTAGFPVDMAFKRAYHDTDNWRISSRLIQGINHYTNLTNADDIDANFAFDYQDSYYDDTQSSNNYAWMWKRAPNFFDVVAYTGNTSGVATQSINHNLGVVPEMMWVKKRNGVSGWEVYHSALGNTKAIRLDTTDTPVTSSGWWNNTSPTDSSFTVGTADWTNASGDTFIAYLFASLDGVSKVGSFSHTFGTDTNVDCGFTSGARFVLIKGIASQGNFTDNWVVYDSERGIVSAPGNDPRLFLNSTSAEENFQNIDPYSAGFTVEDTGWPSGDFIFYAIA